MKADALPPIRVCHVLLSLRPGGLENGVVNVINGLDRASFVSSVCCLQTKGEFAARITDERCEILEFGLKPGNDFGLPRRLADAFRRLRPDIIHTRNAEAFLYGAIAARMARIPLIHSEHGRVFPEKWHRALAQRWLLRGAAAAFAVTKRLAADMVSEIGVPEGRFQVIYNGVDTRKFDVVEREFSVEPREVVIGSVGRLVSVKNYELLLRAVARLPDTLRWRVLLVGEGPERAALERVAAELGISGRVQLAGHRDDVASLLRQMDVFVLPSISEGMSNTLLEAMAAGVAVVGSDVGGNGEIIEADRSGLLFPSRDVDAAYARIRSLLEDTVLRARLAAAGAQRARTTFSMQAMMAAYSGLYRSVWRKTNDNVLASSVA